MSNECLLFDFSGYVKIPTTEVSIVDLETKETKLASDYSVEVLEKRLSEGSLVIESFANCFINSVKGNLEIDNYGLEEI